MAIKKVQRKDIIPPKKEENPIHPIIAFVNDVRMIASFWLRSGDFSSANNFVAFLESILANFGTKKVGLLRLDSGFFQIDVFDYLESKSLNYIISAKFTHPIQRLIDKQDAWLKVDDGIEIKALFCKIFMLVRLL